MSRTRSLTTVGEVEAEIKEMMGLFDAPSFRGEARNWKTRCAAWPNVADGHAANDSTWFMSACDSGPAPRPAPGTGRGSSPTSIESLWPLSEAEPPQWAESPTSLRKQFGIARDLIAAVRRFNDRWVQFLDGMKLEAANAVIDQYNRYYVLEKECVMGSARLAARFFTPVPLLTREQLLRDHPLLPVPELLDLNLRAG